jgi:hypothetical protein
MIVDVHSMHRWPPTGRSSSPRGADRGCGSGPSLRELPEAVDVDEREGVALLRRPRLRRE